MLLNLSENIKISDLIKIAVNKINTILYNEKLNYQLSDRSDNYDLKPSKKNGDPKLDLPSIDRDAALGTTLISNFSLVYQKKELICMKKRDKCRICIVY